METFFNYTPGRNHWKFDHICPADFQRSFDELLSSRRVWAFLFEGRYLAQRLQSVCEGKSLSIRECVMSIAEKAGRPYQYLTRTMTAKNDRSKEDLVKGMVTLLKKSLNAERAERAQCKIGKNHAFMRKIHEKSAHWESP